MVNTLSLSGRAGESKNSEAMNGDTEKGTDGRCVLGTAITSASILA